jgi:hypothetical protein
MAGGPLFTKARGPLNVEGRRTSVTARNARNLGNLADEAD